jgi:hypothetical protein
MPLEKAVRGERTVAVIRGLRDPAGLREASDPADVELDDVDPTAIHELEEREARRLLLACGDVRLNGVAETAVTVEVVRRQRLLDPERLVLGEAPDPWIAVFASHSWTAGRPPVVSSQRGPTSSMSRASGPAPSRAARTNARSVAASLSAGNQPSFRAGHPWAVVFAASSRASSGVPGMTRLA